MLAVLEESASSPPYDLPRIIAALFPDEAPAATEFLGVPAEPEVPLPPPPVGMEWCKRGDKRNSVLNSSNVAKVRRMNWWEMGTETNSEN